MLFVSKAGKNKAVLTLGWTLIVAGVAVGAYAYVIYPILVWMIAQFSEGNPVQGAAIEWPEVTVVLPVHNEDQVIAGTLDAILAVDYPKDQMHILVVSDASTDRTDEIVDSYKSRGVRLIRMPLRAGKTAAENEARHHVRGQIVVNTDASVRIASDALKPLVAAFRDPAVGVASGRDVSVARGGDANVGEGGYVGYEMLVRAWETRAGGIVGASGCFFGSRVELHEQVVPSALSRDFAAPLIAREHGYRSVSVQDAVCYVPRQGSLRREYRRKVRTMTRGLETLFFKRTLLNPFRFGRFAWMLMSHKLIRWLVPWAAVAVLVGGGIVAFSLGLGAVYMITVGVASLLSCLAWFWPLRYRVPVAVSLPAYVVLGLVAGVHAWIKAALGELNPIWEPTKRDSIRVG